MKDFKCLRFMPFFLLIFLLTAPGLMAQGHFEFGLHFSGWSLNIIKNLVDDAFNNVAEEFVNSTEEEIQVENPDYFVEDWNSDVDFTSGGSNWGMEMRWYPRGHDGSFSLGLSMERTTMNLTLDRALVNVSLRTYVGELGGMADINASGGLVIKPTAFMLSMRWNIMPLGRFSPYFQLGVGFASINALKKAELSYDFNYTFIVPGEEDEAGSESEKKTLEEINNEREEGEESLFDQVPFLPFFNMVIGVRARIIQNVHLLFEGGIFNGFIYRAGLSIRF
jgi:hypothetical protein